MIFLVFSVFFGGKIQVLEARKGFSNWNTSASDRAHRDLLETINGFVGTGRCANREGSYGRSTLIGPEWAVL